MTSLTLPGVRYEDSETNRGNLIQYKSFDQYALYVFVHNEARKQIEQKQLSTDYSINIGPKPFLCCKKKH